MSLYQKQRKLHFEERVLNQQRIIFDALVLSIASPEQIRAWAERKLSNGSIVGEVLNSKTVDYKTYKPLRDGLFCERIFGPVTDFRCSCGKKRPSRDVAFCSACEVDYCRSTVRRHRLGYIDLFSAVTHLWYFKGRPNYIAALLKKRPKNLEALVYCTTALIDAQCSGIFPAQFEWPRQELVWEATSTKKLPENISSLIKHYKEKKRAKIIAREKRDLAKRAAEPGAKATRAREAFLNNLNNIMSRFEDGRREQKDSPRKPSQITPGSRSNIATIIDIPIPDIPIPNEKPSDYNYKPSQILPFSTTATCESCHRTQGLSFFVSSPEPEDYPLWIFARVSDSPSDSSNDVPSDLAPGQDNDLNVPFDVFLQSYLAARDQGIQNLLSYTGGEAIKQLLARLDLVMIMRCLAQEMIRIAPIINVLAKAKFHTREIRRYLRIYMKRRLSYVRRFRIAQIFHRTQKNPAWMTISVLPVLPPNLRPILVIDDELVSSDVTRLYQRVLFRNNRLKRTRILDLDILGFSQRLLQEAVDVLIENGKAGTSPVRDLKGRPLKSLSDRLKGKRGRFRQNLLGKRVDYSGRSVIVVGPKMLLHQCGLPREMALELFAPFLIRYLLETGHAPNIIAARRYVDTHHPTIWPHLTDLMRDIPVLLNRAPTLHRLGIQAFQPHLVAGQAILLHPLVCTAFNADFDGDQMAVHIPLSHHARAEAWKLLWSRNNLLAPATGQPILMPSQDMVLGCYYLTTDGLVKKIKDVGAPKKPKVAHYRWEYHYFNGFLDAMQAFSQEHVTAHTPVWFKLDTTQRCQTEKKEEQEDAAPPREIQIDQQGDGMICFARLQEYIEWPLSTDHTRFQGSLSYLQSQFIITTIGRIFMNHLFETSSQGELSQYLQRRMNSLAELLEPEVESVQDVKPEPEIDNALESDVDNASESDAGHAPEPEVENVPEPDVDNPLT